VKILIREIKDIHILIFPNQKLGICLLTVCAEFLQKPRAILRSSSNSLAVLSIFYLEKSLTASPSMTVHLPPGAIWHGNEYMIPSGTPYEFPSEMTPMLTYPFSSEVPYHQSCTWSQAALAAEAADDLPITEMISAPLFCTLVRNGPSTHLSSLITPLAAAPPIVAW